MYLGVGEVYDGVFRACGRDGAMWASPPTEGRKGCVRETSLPPALRATSLAEGGFMLRRCRGIRGDVGIAPYERSIEGAFV